MTAYFCEWAWLPDGCAANVRIVIDGTRIADVRAGAPAQPADERLPGIVLPGLANTHSHAFHRALRGRTHAGGGTFWTWREAMYAVAGRLTPDAYYALAVAVFAEMALSGITCVGEFHYLHHTCDGTAYPEPNAMGLALTAAARAAGIRITLLDACYLAGGLGPSGHLPLAAEQLRFADDSATDWARRWAALADDTDVRIGAAIHSVRAVPAGDLPLIVEASHGRPLHLHLSEQPAENEQCIAGYGVTPARLLADAGALGPMTTVVHATHVSDRDIELLGSSGTSISLCPTTERDLADGIGPARALLDACSPLTLGSDQNAIIDLFEEARAIEMNERLRSQQRGRFQPPELISMLTDAGHRSLGWPDAGRLEIGARADLVALRRDSVRTAGAAPDQTILAAGAPDVDTVIVDGRVVVTGGRHRLGDLATSLERAIQPLWLAT